MTYAASGITVRIGSAILLDDVSIGVEPGEIVAVAGPNGAGKTTLLDVLSGDRRSDAPSWAPIARWPSHSRSRKSR